MPCVKAPRCLSHVQQAHIGRQPAIEGPQDFVRCWPAPFVILLFPPNAEMRHLRPRVHACIRAPRALDVHRALEEILSRFPHLALYRSRIALFLPATVFGAVVLNG